MSALRRPAPIPLEGGPTHHRGRCVKDSAARPVTRLFAKGNLSAQGRASGLWSNGSASACSREQSPQAWATSEISGWKRRYVGRIALMRVVP